MSSLRTVITFAIPAVTALFGLLWIFRKKKPPERKKVTDGKGENEDKPQVENHVKDHVQQVSNSDGNNSADDVKLKAYNKDKLDEKVVADVMERSHRSSEESDKESCGVQEEIIVSEQITTVIESILTCETVSETSVKPENEMNKLTDVSKTEITPEVKSKSESSVSDSLISQIIVTDLNTAPSNDRKDCMQEDVISGNEIRIAVSPISESISPKVNDKVNISPEIIVTKPAETEMSKSEDSMSLNSNTDIKSEEPVSELKKQEESDLENKNDVSVNVNDISKEETSQMSRSWHEDVEESEKNDLKKDSNASSELNESSNTDISSVKDLPTAVSNHVKDSPSPVKLVRNERQSFTKERTSTSPPSKSSSPTNRNLKQAKDESPNHSESSSNCDNSSEASNDSGKGGSVGDSLVSHQEEDRVFEFNIPTNMCGLFIGTRGKTIKQMQEHSGARIHLKNNPYTSKFQICVIEGSEAVIDKTCKMIKRKFPNISMPGIDITSVSNTVIMPEIMQLSLPESISIDVVVSSIVDAGRVFVQQPTHPSFPSLERLNSFMNQCYHHDGASPDIPKPIESGVICAAPMLNGWYRAQIMVYNEESDECDIKYVDYGGYSRISSRCLKQIRSDFMTLPFEAVECYLANITPLENEQYFSAEAAVILEELTQGKMLQAQVIGKADDGIPYVHIYQIGGPSQSLFVNREMVNRGVVRWLEMLS